jgi:folate-binding protein YgfZ
MTIYNRGEYLLVDTDLVQAKKIRATFDHYIIMDDVELGKEPEKLATIGVHGPRAADTLRTAGIATSEQDSIAIEDVEWKALNISVVLIRANSFEIWLPLSDSRQMWDALVAAGATPVGTDAMEMWRIAEGLPLYGRDIREKELPQETAQDRALNFTKGCYVGQEIVERIRSRGAVHRTLTGFRFAGDAPAVGTKVIKDGREVGEITSITKLPLASGPIAIGLGYVRREAGAPGTKLDAGGAEATVATLPFSL